MQCNAKTQEAACRVDRVANSRYELGVLGPLEVLQVLEKPEERPVVQVPTLRQICVDNYGQTSRD